MMALEMGLASVPHRVVVVGGTHGNEYTGVFVCERLQLQHASLKETYPSLAVETLLANPKAHAANTRFVDTDLNRMFSSSNLHDINQVGYECDRAKVIENALGPKGTTASADMIVDLHSTTANMGCTLIVNSYSSLALRTAAYAKQRWSEACTADAAGRKPPSPHELRVYMHDLTQDAAPYLSSVGRDGITIEVGPTPQGVLRADAVASTERALRLILEYLELHYSGRAPAPAPTLEVFYDLGKIPWEGGSSGLPRTLIACSLQDRDFEPLAEGDALFERLDGSSVVYDGSLGEVVHPIFVNEAAYYYAQSGRGIAITKRVDWPLH